MTDIDLTGAVWRRSSRSSAESACVEAATVGSADDRRVAVRDSKNPDGPALAVTPGAFATFLRSAPVRG